MCCSENKSFSKEQKQLGQSEHFKESFWKNVKPFRKVFSFLYHYQGMDWNKKIQINNEETWRKKWQSYDQKNENYQEFWALQIKRLSLDKEHVSRLRIYDNHERQAIRKIRKNFCRSTMRELLRDRWCHAVYRQFFVMVVQQWFSRAMIFESRSGLALWALNPHYQAV